MSGFPVQEAKGAGFLRLLIFQLDFRQLVFFNLHSL